MFNLDKIKVKDFFMLDNEKAKQYIELQQLLVSKETFLNKKLKPLGRLEFGQVLQLKNLFANPSLVNLAFIFKICYKIDRYDFYKADFIAFSYALKGIKENLEKLIKKEQLLKTDTDPLLELAGVKSLSVFKEQPILTNLGERYSKAPEDIAKWSYNMIFSILLYDVKKAEIEKKYNKLKSKQK